MKTFIRLISFFAIIGFGYALIVENPNIIGDTTINADKIKKMVEEIVPNPVVEWDNSTINRQLELGNDSLYRDGIIESNVHTRIFASTPNNSSKSLKIELSTLRANPSKKVGYFDYVDEIEVFVDNDWIVLEKKDGTEVYATLINKIDSTNVSDKLIEFEINPKPAAEHEIFSTVRIVSIQADSANATYDFYDRGAFRRTGTYYKASRYGL